MNYFRRLTEAYETLVKNRDAAFQDWQQAVNERKPLSHQNQLRDEYNQYRGSATGILTAINIVQQAGL